MEAGTVFQIKEVCCARKCIYPEGSHLPLQECATSSEHAWVLGVVHELYPYRQQSRLKSVLLREILPNGTVIDPPFSCFFFEDLALWADAELHLGDTVCLYQPVVYKWKVSAVCPQYDDYRAEVQPGGSCRVLKFLLTGRRGCSACRRQSPELATSSASSGRRLRKRQRPTGASSSGAGPATPGGQTRKARRRDHSGGGGSPSSSGGSTSPSVLLSTLRPALRHRQSQSPAAPDESPQSRRRRERTPETTQTTPDQNPPAATDPQVTPAADSAAPAPTDASPDTSRASASDFLSRAPASDPSDPYTLLADIGRDDPHLVRRPNLMGVIVSVPQPPRLTARSYMVMAAIKDPSCRADDAPRFDFLMFGFVHSSAELSDAAPDHGLRVGNILRARHVKVESRLGKLDGRVFRGAALTAFSGAVGDPLTPLGADQAAPAVSDADRARLIWLREWWAVEQPHLERIAAATDAQLGQVLRPGLYNLKCELLELHEVGGTVFVRVRDGTRCGEACAEPRLSRGEDEPDDPDEPETQVFRDQPDSVFVRVAERRCVAALRSQRAAGCRYVQLLHVRVSDELQQEETCSSGLAFALLTEDEPLVLQLGSWTEEAQAIQTRLPAAVQNSRQTPPLANRPPSADNQPQPTASADQPVPSTSADQPVPSTSVNQLLPSTRADHQAPHTRTDRRGPRTTADQSVVRTGTNDSSPWRCRMDLRSAATHPARAEVGSGSTEVDTGELECVRAQEPRQAGTGGKETRMQEPGQADNRGKEIGAPGSRKTDGGGLVAKVRASIHRALASQEAEEQLPGGTSSQASSSASFPVLRERLDLPDTETQTEKSSQSPSQPVGPTQSSQASVGVSDLFTTAPQSPVSAAAAVSPAASLAAPRPSDPSAVVTDAALPLVPFAALAAQPAERRFRTRCVLRCSAVPADGNPVPLLAAACLAPSCRALYRGQALPAIRLKDDLVPAHLCVRCGAELLLSLQLPLRLCGGPARGQPPADALAVGDAAELLLATLVRLTSLPALRRRLVAVAAALRAGVSGEVGLLPLPESDRRYMVVDTVLTGIQD